MAVTLEHHGSVVGVRRGLSSRAAAEAYIGGVCFKLGPPLLIGAELEWLTAHSAYRRPGAVAPRPPLDLVAAALGPYAPQTIAPASPARPLPGGSRVTIEPGGQIELSSAACPDAARLCARLDSDTRLLRQLLGTKSIRLVWAAADTGRRPQRMLRLPRYHAMERYLGGIGPFGALMMCNTAATQVSVDAGTDPAELAARWQTLYMIGPALLAAFARSPALCGAPPGVWASQRMRTWLRLDYARTRPPVQEWADPVSGYARWALDAPLLCVRRPAPARQETDGECAWSAPPGATFADWISGALDDEVGRRPGYDDLDYHLTTLFPPVRAAGHLEVRYLDAQPGDSWSVPIRVIEALMSTSAVVRDASTLAAPTAGRWLDAARHGLADPQIRTVATDLLETAAEHATTAAAPAIHAAARRCRAGRPPEESGDRA
ncbi:ergothioneine biosynthesis glutamate--cysteine ligase EgtA [Nocardia donostiensis]|uniref:Glutamate--cysteine ligase EgtA n=1 Tax=Nocardia donostiensis TaxID=1538463 RepID=A0A1W0BDL5_9NOCA|nr:ergothioneine biosynthesis glutamate--cysteine ligase EgtA [Nocardia donostiensis]ONM48296.1 ergothioneine biosynthesis glutamate--cysteine ligase EgtA [Nocardia donostiensis]OQS14509.1 ergothioneine biosynthesis glutamate--cysteine ligase EgtA [Nocardia donostiensis]OQS20594.1 ergothioneine biosynthesis glutamate--cysteine ligase EgtA [Nocardia donostiensis]